MSKTKILKVDVLHPGELDDELVFNVKCDNCLHTFTLSLRDLCTFFIDNYIVNHLEDEQEVEYNE